MFNSQNVQYGNKPNVALFSTYQVADVSYVNDSSVFIW